MNTILSMKVDNSKSDSLSQDETNSSAGKESFFITPSPSITYAGIT